MRLSLPALMLIMQLFPEQTNLIAQDNVRYVSSPDVVVGSAAVIVPDQPLIHTAQILPVHEDGTLTAADAKAQVRSVFDELNAVLKDAESSLSLCAKLNFCVADPETTEIVMGELTRRFADQPKPAVSFVVSVLPVAGALISVDAVATVAATNVSRDTPASDGSTATVRLLKHAAVLPAGSRIYVSGQAEPSDSLAESTRRTLESLGATLKFLERSTADIVQLKAFVMPMTDAAIVRREVSAYFGDRPGPPLILVEWKSSARTPIEIELIASGGPASPQAEVIEYRTPPGMTQSPVYSRLTRIHHGATVYISGLFAASQAADPSLPAAGEREVREIFGRLDRILKESGSDLRHLAKATYYVSTEAASMKLNELRPRYYDPLRPPAASKAVVAGVGRDQLGLTIDMIAVPFAPARVSDGVPPSP